MQDFGQSYGATAWDPPPQPPAPRRSGPRWLLISALAIAFTLALGVGAVLGSTLLQTAHAANSGPAVSNSSQTLAAGPGAQGQCGVLTVSSVNGQTIVAKAPDGSTVTIHTTASTQYTRAGQSVAASSVTVGSQIHVDGTHNSDGSITATRIDIR